MKIKTHLDINSILLPNQHGFRKHHSTATCLAALMDDLVDARDKGLYTAVASLDLSKAFDALHPDGITSTLNAAGFNNKSKNLIMNYITNRDQVVKLGNVTSSKQPLHFGVPQGSVLGPLLFTLYVNELQIASKVKNLVTLQFADDTTVYISAKTAETAICSLETGLSQIANWLSCNSLKLNPDKTQFMVVEPFKAASKTETPPVNRTLLLSGVKVLEQPSIELLGFIIDNGLTLEDQAVKVKNKVRSGTFALRIASKNHLPLPARKQIYNSVVGCHLNYADIVVGSGSKTALNLYQSGQDKAIRALLNKPVFCDTEKLREHLQWLPLSGKRSVHEMTLVWKALHEQAPKQITSRLNNENRHSHATRLNSSNGIRPPEVPETKSGQRSFYRRAISKWNKLDPEAREAASSTACRNLVFAQLWSNKNSDFIYFD